MARLLLQVGWSAVSQIAATMAAASFKAANALAGQAVAMLGDVDQFLATIRAAGMAPSGHDDPIGIATAAAPATNPRQG